MLNKFVTWAGRRHKVLAEDKTLEMVKIGTLDAANKVEYDSCFWVRTECVKPFEGNSNES